MPTTTTSRHTGTHRVAVSRKDERKTARQLACLTFALAALATITGMCLLAGWWGGSAAADSDAPSTIYLHMAPTPATAPVMPLQVPAVPTPRTAGGR